jgi:hypothetical protein
MWTRLYAAIEGARFEARSDLIVAICHLLGVRAPKPAPAVA